MGAVPPEEGAQNHHTSGITTTNAIAEDTDPTCHAAAGFEDRFILNSEDVLNCSDGTLTAVGAISLILKTRCTGILN